MWYFKGFELMQSTESFGLMVCFLQSSTCTRQTMEMVRPHKREKKENEFYLTLVFAI